MTFLSWSIDKVVILFGKLRASLLAQGVSALLLWCVWILTTTNNNDKLELFEMLPVLVFAPYAAAYSMWKAYKRDERVVGDTLWRELSGADMYGAKGIFHWDVT